MKTTQQISQENQESQNISDVIIDCELEQKWRVLSLKVNNHPGVMSHICGLFTRRSFNVEAILCMPLADDQHSRIWLRVMNDDRLLQIIAQLQKLRDVLSVQQHSGHHPVFLHVACYCSQE